MDPIPEWLLRWLFTKAIDLAFSGFWKSYGRAWLHSGNQRLLRVYVWYQVTLTWLAMSIALSLRQKESVPAEEPDVEELREAVRHFTPVADTALLPQFRVSFDAGALAQFRSNLYTDAFSQVRSSMRDGFRVDPFAGVGDRYKAGQYAAMFIRSSSTYPISEAAWNSFKANQYMSPLARTAEEIRKSFVANPDMGMLARTAEEARKSFVVNPLSGFRDRP